MRALSRESTNLELASHGSGRGRPVVPYLRYSAVSAGDEMARGGFVVRVRGRLWLERCALLLTPRFWTAPSHAVQFFDGLFVRGLIKASHRALLDRIHP